MRLVSTGKVFSSPSANVPALAIILHVSGLVNVEGMEILNLTAVPWLAGAVKLCCGLMLPNKASTGSSVMASNNSSVAFPFSSLSLRLLILALNSILSPSRINLGAFAWSINVFWLTTVFWFIPNLASLSWASICHFHCVRASGKVKVNERLPSLPAVSWGKKKAVSLKLVRMLTTGSSLPFVSSMSLAPTLFLSEVAHW